MQCTQPPPPDSRAPWFGQGDALAVQGDTLARQGDAFGRKVTYITRKATLFGQYPQDRVTRVHTPPLLQPGD